MVGRLKMTLKSRLLKLEKIISETSRSPVTWAAILDGQLIPVCRDWWTGHGHEERNGPTRSPRSRSLSEVWTETPGGIDP